MTAVHRPHNRTQVSSSPSRSQSSPLVAITSVLTGRVLQRNPSPDQFHVLPNSNVHSIRDSMRASCDEFEKRTAQVTCAGQRRHYQRALNVWREWVDVSDYASAEKFIHALVAMSKWPVMCGSKSRVCALLTQLWAQDVLVWPDRPVWDLRDPPLVLDAALLGRHWEWMSIMTMELHKSHRAFDLRRCAYVILGRVRGLAGLQTLGDLTPDTIGAETFAPHFPHERYEILSVEQTAAHPKHAELIARMWPRRKRPPRHKNDRSFQWALDADPLLADWVELFRQWCSIGKNKYPLRTGDLFLRYLVAHPSVTRDPSEYCQRSYRCPISFVDSDTLKAWKHAGGEVNAVHAFFEWFLDTHASADDDQGARLRFAGFFNPITRASYSTRPSETTRTAMPMRYMREMIEILTENDYAWPKTFRFDYFLKPNPAGGKPIRTWSPVCAGVLLLKMSLPLRTFQARALESSEGDNERYRMDADGNGIWETNTLPHAPQPGRYVRRSALRQFKEAGQKSVLGFFINTNKTQDRAPNEQEKGYEIYWENKLAVRIIALLDRFQSEQNPITQPLAWSALSEACFATAAPRPGAAFFLMRDPCHKHAPNEPITDSRVRYMWRRLNQEFDRRLQARGAVDHDGNPIRVVEDTPGLKDSARRALFDLHTTRVSILSALATEGGVPLAILSKCIAGHASALMTLYYVKPKQSQINDTLEAAGALLGDPDVEMKNFRRYLRDEAAKTTKTIPISVVGGPSALAALNPATVAGWEFSDIGMCPVGGTLCHEGGPKDELGRGHRPVPGGARNCPSCRFFFSGPGFLLGLEARFNGMSVRVREMGQRRAHLMTSVARFEDELIDAEAAAAPVDELRRLRQRLEIERTRDADANAEADQLANDWHALTHLIDRCVEAKNKRQALDGDQSNAVDLVPVGTHQDLARAIRFTTDFKLFQTVCECSVLHPVAETAIATMRRAGILDLFLARAQSTPMFSQMSDADSLVVGNQFIALMNMRLGVQRVETLMTGAVTPSDEVRRALAVVLTEKLALPQAAPALVTARLLTQVKVAAMRRDMCVAEVVD